MFCQNVKVEHFYINIQVLGFSRRSRFINAPSCNTAATAVKSLQSCPTLCDPIDGSPPRSPVPGILQARILEWVAISFSKSEPFYVHVNTYRTVYLFFKKKIQTRAKYIYCPMSCFMYMGEC